MNKNQNAAVPLTVTETLLLSMRHAMQPQPLQLSALYEAFLDTLDVGTAVAVLKRLGATPPGESQVTDISDEEYKSLADEFHEEWYWHVRKVVRRRARRLKKGK